MVDKNLTGTELLLVWDFVVNKDLIWAIDQVVKMHPQ